MYIKKARAGSVPGYTWDKDGAVVEVHDELAEELLMIPHGGFTVAAAPQEQPEKEDIHEVAEEPDAVDEEETSPEPKKTGGRPKLPRDEHGKIIRN